MSQLFSSDGWSIGVSASTSVLPVNIQDWFPLGLTGWMGGELWERVLLTPSSPAPTLCYTDSASFQPQHQSFQWVFRTNFLLDWLAVLEVQGTLKTLLQLHSSKASVLQHSAFLMVQLSHPYMTTGKTVMSIALTILDLCWQSNVSAFQYAGNE